MTLLMLYIGIHNAWDTVMYITTEQLPKARAKKAAEKKRPT